MAAGTVSVMVTLTKHLTTRNGKRYGEIGNLEFVTLHKTLSRTGVHAVEASRELAAGGGDKRVHLSRGSFAGLPEWRDASPNPRTRR